MSSEVPATRPPLLVPLALLAAIACLYVGLTQPVMEVRWMLVVDRPVSLLDGVRGLWQDGDWPMAAILLGFSFAFPLVKIATLLVLWVRLRRGGGAAPRLPALLGALGRWSMLDVLVVALVVFAIRARPLAEARVAPAILAFLAALLLIAWASRMVERFCRNA